MSEAAAMQTRLSHIAQLAYGGRFHEAIELCRALAQDYPEELMVRFCLARLSIAVGEWRQGLEHFESTRGSGVFGGPYLTKAKPIWNNEDPSGKRILLASEGGLGDAICFSRFAGDLQRRGAEVVLGTHVELFPLLRSLPSHPQLVDLKAIDLVDFDCWTPALSAPLNLGLDYEAIRGEPYLRCPNETLLKWMNILGQGKPRIGLIWQGREQFAEDSYRSVPARLLTPLLAHEEYQFVTIQGRHPTNPLHDTRLLDLSHLVANPSDLAGFLSRLDLLISVDTGPAHLAASMGVPTILLNRVFGWFVFGCDFKPGPAPSPFYQSMLMVNQQTHGDWSKELSFIDANLDSLFAGRRDLRDPDQTYHPSNPVPSREVVRPVQTRLGPMLTVPNDFYVGRALDIYGEYSQAELELFNTLVPVGGVVVEGGAHIGALTVGLAQRLGPTGKMLAFEPQPFLANILKANLAINNISWVRVMDFGLAEAPGHAPLPLLDYSRVGNFGGVELKSGFEKGEIELITLDSLNLPGLDFMKLDIEGMELSALLGAEQTILKFKPLLFIEVDRADKAPQILELLKRWGYQYEPINTRLFNAKNFRGNPHNIYGEITSYNLLARPLL